MNDKILRPVVRKNILTDRKISPLARLIYVFINDYIIEHMYKRNFVFSNETIALEFKITVSTVKRRLKELKDANYINIIIDNNNRHYISLIEDEKKLEYNDMPSSFKLLFENKHLSFKEIKDVCIEFVKTYTKLTYTAEQVDYDSDKYAVCMNDTFTIKIDNYNKVAVYNDRLEHYMYKEESNKIWNGIYKNQKTILESIKNYIKQVKNG
jgi:DNA-binding MarR family transcriptional regulator